MSTRIFFAIALLGCAVVSSAYAQTPVAEGATFFRKAALGGMTEVELAKVAQSKSQDANVRKFADDMVKDHGKANIEIASVAKRKGISLPTSLDAEHQEMVKELSARSGADFDAEYTHLMVVNHEKTIALFEAATRSSDPDVAAFAKKTLPTLKEHEHMTHGLPGSGH